MFKKTITYKDYNESERTEDFYFHLTRAELLEMEMTTPGGYKTMLERIIKAQDVPTLYKTFKEFIFFITLLSSISYNAILSTNYEKYLRK